MAPAPPSLALPVRKTCPRDLAVTVSGSAPAAEVGIKPIACATAVGGFALLLNVLGPLQPNSTASSIRAVDVLAPNEEVLKFNSNPAGCNVVGIVRELQNLDVLHETLHAVLESHGHAGAGNVVIARGRIGRQIEIRRIRDPRIAIRR